MQNYYRELKVLRDCLQSINDNMEAQATNLNLDIDDDYKEIYINDL